MTHATMFYSQNFKLTSFRTHVTFLWNGGGWDKNKKKNKKNNEHEDIVETSWQTSPRSKSQHKTKEMHINKTAWHLDGFWSVAMNKDINEHVGNDQCSESKSGSLHHACSSEQQHSSQDKEAGVTPTCLDNDRHGGLLNDGSYSWEGGEAAVVSSAVLLHSVREVKVSVQAHRHPLILFYVLKIWAQKEDDFILILFYFFGHLPQNQSIYQPWESLTQLASILTP